VPAPYLTREAWLHGYRFYVDERVIVPRSFLAPMILEHFQPWLAEPENVLAALDLCTGSGCLAILLAEAFPDATVDAVDLSPDALEVARRNVADYGLDERVRLHQGDLFAPLEGDTRKPATYDLIVSNPPYVNAESVAALPPEYRHEPSLALGSGDDGLDATRVILRQAARHLNPGGLLAVEIGHNREALEAAFPRSGFRLAANRRRRRHGVPVDAANNCVIPTPYNSSNSRKPTHGVRHGTNRHLRRLPHLLLDRARQFHSPVAGRHHRPGAGLDAGQGGAQRRHAPADPAEIRPGHGKIRPGSLHEARRTGISVASVIGNLVYWLIILVMIVTVANSLGLQMVADLFNKVVLYIPNVIVAILVLVFGTILARFINRLVFAWLNNMEFDGALTVSTFSEYAMMVFVFFIAMEQLQIANELLTAAFIIAFGAIGLAFAIAFGLGAKDWAAKVIERLVEKKHHN
jgi:ribosomal protein L3-specific protein-(glutamine-N5) methyltransferase